MNADNKKIFGIMFTAMFLLAVSHAAAQGILDDGFPETPEVQNGTPPHTGMAVLGRIISEADTLANEGEEAVINERLTTPPPAPVRRSAMQEKTIDLDPVISAPVATVAVNGSKSAASASPSEQVVGAIAREVFHDMSNLESENTLLGLQLKKEQLRNEINSVKNQQRQAYLEEIDKRELSARTRVEWEHQQELRRIELWERQERARVLSKQIKDMLENKPVAATASRDEIEATVREVVQDELAGREGSFSGNTDTRVRERLSLNQLYYITEVRGTGDSLVARIVDHIEKKVFFVKQGTVLPTGHRVTSVAKDHIVASLNGKNDVIGFSVLKE